MTSLIRHEVYNTWFSVREGQVKRDEKGGLGGGDEKGGKEGRRGENRRCGVDEKGGKEKRRDDKGGEERIGGREEHVALIERGSVASLTCTSK